MRAFRTVLASEIRQLLVNPGTYIVAALFLFFVGFVFQSVLEIYTENPQDTSPAIFLFNIFWLPVLFMVPLLTMRSIAEERRLGTLETLLTAPITPAQVVLAKYLACLFLYLLLWAATAGFVVILNVYSQDDRLLDPGPLIGGYLFIGVSGLFYVALGVLASAWSRNQPVAGILSFVLLFAAIFGVRLIGDISFFHQESLAPLKSLLEQAEVFRHLGDFTRGVVDTRQILFHLSGAVIALALGVLGVEIRLLQH